MRNFVESTRIIALVASILIGIIQPKIVAAKCPCDFYTSAGTPCVAAHSTVRALYSSYNGPLYQVRRKADNKTMDIGVLTPGGFANSAAQDSFLNNATGTISKIYDQSPKGNHLTVGPAGEAGGADTEANAKALKVWVNGYPVYAVYITSGSGYRNDKTSGIATGDQPEGEYMVASGKHVNNLCCFDYGNAETNNRDVANGHMEAIYLGTCPGWGHGSGNGPWVMGDLENGLFAGGTYVDQNNTSVPYDYVTGMVKGKPGMFAVKGGNAQTGNIKTMYEGASPAPPAYYGYNPMAKEGAIILGVGGDNSNGSIGTFFEGCMTSGYPPDATEDSVQANIVAAGYGKTTPPVSVRHNVNKTATGSLFKVNCNRSIGSAVITYALRETGRVSITVVDHRGRRIAVIADDILPEGGHTANWNTKRIPAGVYVCMVEIDGMESNALEIVIGR